MHYRSHLSQLLSAEDMESIRKQSAAHAVANPGITRHGSTLSQMSTNSPRNSDSPGYTAPSPQVSGTVSTSSPRPSSASDSTPNEKVDSVSCLLGISTYQS